jgi:RNA polymerase-binding transcription factor DksA
MNKSDKVKLTRTNNVINLGKNNQSILENDSFAREKFDQIEQGRNRINGFFSQINSSGKPITEHKKRARKALEKCVVMVAGYLYSYGFDKGIPEFKDFEYFQSWKIKRMSDLELIESANNLLRVITLKSEAAIAALVTVEVKDGLEEKLACFKDWLEKPRNLKKMKRDITEEIQKEFRQIDLLIDNVLSPYMKSKYSENNYTFYKEYQRALEVDEPSRSHRALSGKLTEAETGKPVNDVKISIDGKKATRHCGKLGIFYFNSLSAGPHTLEFSKKGYVNVTKNIVIISGRTLKLDVVIEMLKVEETVDS